MSGGSESAESELSPELFDGTFDSEWWRAKRGKPPLSVIIGVWLLDGPAALAVGGISGAFVFGALLGLGIWFGLIDRLETRYTPPIVVMLLIGIAAALAIAWRFLRHAIRTTRLFLLLQSHSDYAFERALKRYEREVGKKKQRRKH